MKMTKKEWYENRILWKVNRNEMFDDGYQRFENLSSEKQQAIRDMFGDTQDVLIVLWENQNKFTLVSTDEFFCNYDGDIFRVGLDDIEEVRWAWDDNKSQRENKTETEFFYVNGHKIFSGKAFALTGLMNLLKMFPVNVPPQ